MTNDYATMHTITGMPRSGSTLMCNLMNSRLDVYASSTSTLCKAVHDVATIFTNAPEETARLQNIPGTLEGHKATLRGMMLGWHNTPANVIFDKGRGWTHNAVLFQSLFPEGKMLVTVRDPRMVLASIEKKHRATGVYDGGSSLQAKFEEYMAPNGMVGTSLAGITDLLNRRLPGVYYIQFERLVVDPVGALADIDNFLGMPKGHSYPIDNVENTADDLDILWRNKFPHQGSGPIREPGYHWSEFFTEEIGAWALQQFPKVSQLFGYA